MFRASTPHDIEYFTDEDAGIDWLMEQYRDRGGNLDDYNVGETGHLDVKVELPDGRTGLLVGPDDVYDWVVEVGTELLGYYDDELVVIP